MNEKMPITKEYANSIMKSIADAILKEMAKGDMFPISIIASIGSQQALILHNVTLIEAIQRNASILANHQIKKFMEDTNK